VNDANPRRHYAQGGPDNESDPYQQDPHYTQQQYGYDPYGHPDPQQPGPQQQGYDTGQYPSYQEPAQTYGGHPPGWIPPQAPPPYYEQQGYDTGQYPAQDYGTGQMPRYGATGYDTGYHPGYDPGYDTGQHAQVPPYDTGQHPQVQAPHDTGHIPAYETGQQPAYREQEAPAASDGDYRTEQFAFLDEDSEESEEVIDWLKFSESRTERREEARRRGRNRRIALVVLVVLAMIGGAGYLYQAGKIPGLKKHTTAAAAVSGSQKRDVIVVHLLPVGGGPSSTALLVDNTTKKHGTTVLIPNAVQLTGDDGTESLDASVQDGVGPTRDALNALLGTDIKGSWRLDSPYLELLVDSLGNVIVDTDTAVKGTGKDKDKVLVPKGEQQELSGQAAVAYATYRAPGEPQTAQLKRFGQVMEAVLEKMPSDAADATKTVQALAQILDPSLTDKELGASLAQLADLAKTGAYSTTVLPVQQDGTLSPQATDSIVKDVLGGAVKQSTGASAQPRVSIKDATGNPKAAPMAQAAIVNGGTYTYVPGGKAAAQPTSQVLYADPSREAAAKDVAATLGLSPTEVKKGAVPSNADIAVVLGEDYQLPKDEG
jgi:anionic cell wall polymer biosynthesis LytR-Cps2A-Psr (LCP) family protein